MVGLCLGATGSLVGTADRVTDSVFSINQHLLVRSRLNQAQIAPLGAKECMYLLKRGPPLHDTSHDIPDDHTDTLRFLRMRPF